MIRAQRAPASKDMSKPKLTAGDLIPDTRLREADRDAFRHAAIAAQVAELAAEAEKPVNIALFGPWGSGKSSFYELLRTKLWDRDKGIRLVRYDAWKFGGASLKRNFLSNAAAELGYHPNRIGGHEFNLGLYETKKTVRFDPKQFLANGRWKGYAYLLAFVFALTCIALIVTALATSIGKEDLSDEISKLAPGMFKFFFAGLFALGTAAKFVDGARIETQQSQPSEDEEFADLFKKLVGRATKDRPLPAMRKTHTLVFFIDELDRCSKRDVVLTLSSLRTFLDQPDCVFIVAADREVLEEALDAVDQATPVREEEPYYSSASEFLDKIFQHQFALPPLRAQRLTGFARGLVAGRGGLWAELEGVEPGGRRLNRVLYALIPAHVRSPRRVKVLLNNYATNARVIQARGIDWLARATEIAKLTVLQTEFPRLAADLHLEPRLPSLLLNPPGNPTDRQRLLLARHSLALHTALAQTPNSPASDESDVDADEEIEGEADVSPSADSTESYEPPDRLLAGRSNAALRRRQQEDLHRYLVSRAAAGIEDPGRDLLYLESAGEPAGLDDAELGQLIEEYGANEPDRVIEALTSRTAAERVAAARVLGQMSEREFGPERVNMITALAGALDGLEPTAVQDQIGDLVENIGSYQAEEDLVPDQLAGILVLAAAAGPAGEDLAKAILRNDALLKAPERVRSVSVLLPVLADRDAEPVERALAHYYPTDPDLLLTVVETADPRVVERLLRTAEPDLVQELTPAPATGPAVSTPAAAAVPVPPTAEEVGAATASLDILLNTIEDRGEPLAEAQVRLIHAFLIEDHVSYAVIKEHARTVLGRVGADTANSLCLAALVVGPTGDWEFWASELTHGGGGSGHSGALVTLIGQIGDGSPQTQAGVTETVRAIVNAGPFEPDTTAISDAAEEELAAAKWWESTTDTAEQIALHRVVRAISTTNDELTSQLDALLAEDVQRANHEEVAWDADVLTAVERLACASSEGALKVAEALAAEAVANGAPAGPTVATRLSIAEELHRRGLPFARIPVEDVIPIATGGEASADELVASWLGTDPLAEEVLAVIAALPGYRAGLARAVEDWSMRTDSDSRTDLFRKVLDNTAIDARWLHAVRLTDTDSPGLAELVAERMAVASAAPARERLVAAAAALNFDAPRTRRAIAGAAVKLLAEQPNKSKSEIALRLVETLNGDYGQMKTAIRGAAIDADAQGQMADKHRKGFERAGLVNKKPKKWGPFTIGS